MGGEGIGLAAGVGSACVSCCEAAALSSRMNLSKHLSRCPAGVATCAAPLTGTGSWFKVVDKRGARERERGTDSVSRASQRV